MNCWTTSKTSLLSHGKSHTISITSWSKSHQNSRNNYDNHPCFLPLLPLFWSCFRKMHNPSNNSAIILFHVPFIIINCVLRLCCTRLSKPARFLPADIRICNQFISYTLNVSHAWLTDNVEVNKYLSVCIIFLRINAKMIDVRWITNYHNGTPSSTCPSRDRDISGIFS